MNDLIGGQFDVMCDQTTNTTNQIKEGKIRGYAVTTKSKVSSLPELPDAGQRRASRLRGFGVARDVGAEGIAQGRVRQARGRTADRSERPESDRTLRTASALSRLRRRSLRLMLSSRILPPRCKRWDGSSRRQASKATEASRSVADDGERRVRFRSVTTLASTT